MDAPTPPIYATGLWATRAVGRKTITTARSPAQHTRSAERSGQSAATIRDRYTGSPNDAAVAQADDGCAKGALP